MSWDVALIGDDDNAVRVAVHEEGGTYALGGTNRADLNVTYNYGTVYRRVVGHNLMDWLDGERAGDTLATLKRVVLALGVERDADYWAATDGNAGHAAEILRRWAEQHPDAKWSVC